MNEDKWDHSPGVKNGEYGENLFGIKWNELEETQRTKETLTEYDQLAIAVEAVNQWYDEYVNYDPSDGGPNGNILHDGQIGHFLQVSFLLECTN